MDKPEHQDLVEHCQKLMARGFAHQIGNPLQALHLGTGIGSYSARLLTQVQNGRIGFETDDERGTRVWFSLPGVEISG